HPPTPQLHALSLHDALPISGAGTLNDEGLGRIALRVEGDDERRAPKIPERRARRDGLDARPDAPVLAEPGDVLELPLGLGKARPDRKSTRLNSSHVKISYAV